MMKKITKKSTPRAKMMTAAVICSLLAVGTAAFLGVRGSLNAIDEKQKNPDVTSSQSDASDSAQSAWDQADEPANTTPDDTQSKTEENGAESSSSAESKDDSSSESKTMLNGFVMPIEGEIITPYSDGEMIKSITLGDWRTHDGVDIAAESGTPVKACNSGEIEEVTVDPLWGSCVTIVHSDGSKSYYMGLDKAIAVEKGDKVALGDVIGKVGETAEIEQALEPHLHFAMKKDGNWINPIANAAGNGDK